VRIYLDAAPVIYLVENVMPYASSLITRLSAAGVTQVCSELTRLECRVKPLRDNEPALLVAFDTYFANIMADIVPLSRSVIDHATDLRAQYGFKTPDALHLAAAINAGCDLFLTNDHRLDKCLEVTIEVVG
jgi:uncharacterized protein